ncbi:MAG: D-alanyl-D-alanine carboxypeptidase/D-alanyl-D-alanine-endopeptidase [Acidobacteria bacterium]|nr:D-alanyl-D-alanine carboxypeptidase/D-alanyl-D-alanine-endopeptidase [Acidobacteriota bacterium]
MLSFRLAVGGGRLLPHLFLAFLLSASVSLAQTADLTGTDRQLAERIVAILQREDASQAHWGIEVVSLRDGQLRFGWNLSKLFVPASTAKLFVTAAALARLGPQFRYRTTLEASAPIAEDGQLQGDLVLVGRGDPNLSGRVLPYQPESGRTAPTTRLLEELSGQLAAQGLRSITGDIVVDDTYFVYQPYGQGWEVDDLLWSYGAPISALALNDNVVSLSVLPGARPGEPARIRLEPPANFYEIENGVLTAAKEQATPGGGAVAASQQRLAIDRKPGSRRVQLWGQIPAGAPGWQGAIAIEDPPQFAGELLRQELAHYDIEVKGAVRVLRRHPSELADLQGMAAPPSAPSTVVLAQHESAILAESLQVITKISQNLHAEMLLRTLGRERRNVGSIEAGWEEVQQFLREIGVQKDAIVLRDASGLSRQNLVTPSAMVTLLRNMYESDQSALWLALLPIAGEDGTLQGRLKGPAVAGRVWAKTGSLAGVAALAGYAANSDDDLLAFAIFINHHNLSASTAAALMDRIVVEIAKSR